MRSGGMPTLEAFRSRGALSHTSSLESELDLLVAGSSGEPQERRRSNVRRREEGASSTRKPSAAHSQEEIWSRLLEHAWAVADSITRESDGGPLTLLPPSDADRGSSHHHLMEFPFLLCSDSADDSGASSSLYPGSDDPRAWAPIEGEGNCAVVSATSTWAREALNSNPELIAQPLVDVMKIHPGTIESATSKAWRVPFQGSSTSRGSSARGERHRSCHRGLGEDSDDRPVAGVGGEGGGRDRSASQPDDEGRAAHERGGMAATRDRGSDGEGGVPCRAFFGGGALTIRSVLPDLLLHEATAG